MVKSWNIAIIEVKDASYMQFVRIRPNHIKRSDDEFGLLTLADLGVSSITIQHWPTKLGDPDFLGKLTYVLQCVVHFSDIFFDYDRRRFCVLSIFGYGVTGSLEGVWVQTDRIVCRFVFHIGEKIRRRPYLFGASFFCFYGVIATH
jgi:hypothetical protein